MYNVTQLMPHVYSWGHRAGQTAAQWWWPSFSAACSGSFWSEVAQQITTFPALYRTWWWNLVTHDPMHVLVETTLLLSMVYILVGRRSKDWRDNEREKLTAAEENELLREWKEQGRAPLTPGRRPKTDQEEDDDEEDDDDDYHDDTQGTATATNNNHNDYNPADRLVVHKLKGRLMEVELGDDPDHVKRTVLNFATTDFLGFSQDPADDPQANPIKVAAQAALDKYGCGSCGPRGFYGTVDVHLHLERAYADYFGTDDAILYSDGASACTSTVAAFCKRGDLLVVDDGIYEPLLTGVMLSRAHVKWFKHNDMDDLRRVMEKVRQADRWRGRRPNAQRRFLVVEGLYKNSGTICPLDQVVALKHEFSYRLILDESLSFGTLGPTGGGVLELFNKKLMYDAEILTVSLENAMGSIGGITTGTEEVVDHQRLSGSGYCFSASSPPFTAVAAVEALRALQEQPDRVQRLQQNQAVLYEKLRTLCHESLEDLLYVASDPGSPLIWLQVAALPETRYLNQGVFLQEVVRESVWRGVALVATRPPLGAPPGPRPAPGLRLTVSAAHTPQDLERAVEVLQQAVEVVLGRFREETTAAGSA